MRTLASLIVDLPLTAVMPTPPPTSAIAHETDEKVGNTEAGIEEGRTGRPAKVEGKSGYYVDDDSG